MDQTKGGWRGRDWSAAWRDAQHRTILDRKLYNAVPHWTKLLSGDPKTSAPYWAGGVVPEPQPVLGGGDHGRMERLACRGRPGMRTPMAKSQPDCESWWPASPTADGRPCVAYVIGIGDLVRGGRGDAWSFPIAAARRGCAVHAYDPTIAIRQRQEEGAARINARLRKESSAATAGGDGGGNRGLGGGSHKRGGGGGGSSSSSSKGARSGDGVGAGVAPTRPPPHAPPPHDPRAPGNVSFHFAGLGAERTHNTTNS